LWDKTSPAQATAITSGEPGARVADRLKRWVVMQAPTRSTFCIVRMQRPGFPKNANRWN
jgi:hypothetical protein